MIFTELVLQNIGSYQGRQKINLSPKTVNGHRPIILLGGMNGSGKTTLMDAIRLALYGYRAQCSTRNGLGYGEFLTQSVNHHAKGQAQVELAFQLALDGEPIELRVCRTWGRNPKGGKDTLTVMRSNDSGMWLDPGLTATWDERIEEILPLGISSLFLFDGEQVKELAEQDLPTQVVIDAIRSLLGLELANRLAIDLDVLLNRKKKELAGGKELEDIENIEKELAQKQDELQIIRQRLAKLEVDKAYAEEQVRLAEAKFISEGGKVSSELICTREKIKNLERHIEHIRRNLIEQATDNLPLLLIENLLEQGLSQAKKEEQHCRVKSSYQLLIERDKKLLTFLEGMPISSELLENVQSFLAGENQALLKGCELEELWLGSDAKLVNRLELLLNDQLPKARKIVNDTLTKLKCCLDEKESLEQIEATCAPEEWYEQLKKEWSQKRHELSQIAQEYDKVEQLHQQAEKAVVEVKEKLSKYTNDQIQKRDSEQLISTIQKAQKTLKIFSERLTVRKLNQLELEVTKCYLHLLHKTDMIHRVAIDTNNFGLSLYDSAGRPVPKHRLSAGEKQLLAISLLWGLARASGRNLPVAIDTPLGRLDSSHRANLVERYFPTASQQVILLSTDTEITQNELEILRKAQTIGREYRLVYDPVTGQTVVKEGYFW